MNEQREGRHSDNPPQGAGDRQDACYPQLEPTPARAAGVTPESELDRAGERSDSVADATQETKRVPVQDGTDGRDGPEVGLTRTNAGTVSPFHDMPIAQRTRDTQQSGESGDVVVDSAQETLEDDSAQHAEDSTPGNDTSAPAAQESP
jgi:hypothetical protein